MQDDNLMEVYSTVDGVKAEIIRGALHAEGIKCEIDGENQAGLTGVNILPVKLLVRAEDFDRARGFIDKHERAE